MLIFYSLLVLIVLESVTAYSNNLYAITNISYDNIEGVLELIIAFAHDFVRVDFISLSSLGIFKNDHTFQRTQPNILRETRQVLSLPQRRCLHRCSSLKTQAVKLLSTVTKTITLQVSNISIAQFILWAYTYTQCGASGLKVIQKSYTQRSDKIESIGYIRASSDNVQFTFQTISTTVRSEMDPLLYYQNIMQQVLFGDSFREIDVQREEDYKLKIGQNSQNYDDDYKDDALGHYPSGKVMHSELFQNKSAVHLPLPELIHRHHSFLKVTNDYMQTAVDAFSIFLEGSLDDVMRLPSSYVLQSARTIAMMKIEKEKLVATWDIIKGDKNPDEISYEVLEMYRPLFKYLNGREIARLNLSDDRILTFIGTHSDLDRHQVGVVASRYIEINRRWTEPRYLNQMNNLLCGVPMTFMRRISESTYLQLSHQLFYHIKACDPLQRRFYLTMMTKTQALGKSYSWSARDVSRLGLLLSEINGPELAAINPESMSGLTAQVMLEIPPHTLKYITEMQLRYISQKPLNILAKRLKIYQDQVRMSNANIIFQKYNFIKSMLGFLVRFLVNKNYLRKL